MLCDSSQAAAAAAAAAKSLQSCPTLRPHKRQPTRLPRPWDSPGKNTGVGCHFLLQCMKVKSESEVAQSCPTLSDPMDCSLPGSSVDKLWPSWIFAACGLFSPWVLFIYGRPLSDLHMRQNLILPELRWESAVRTSVLSPGQNGGGWRKL